MAHDPDEGNLHELTDDTYFQNLHDDPAQIFDAEGNPVDITADVIDARGQKAAGVL